MFIETHVIQNFAPSCLNRDDTNTPKDCVFGGVRRARISSQCIKRALRTHVKEYSDMSDSLGVRTKSIQGKLLEKLPMDGRSEEDAIKAISTALSTQKLSVKENKTEYVLFLGNNEIDQLAEAVNKHWDELLAAEEPEEGKGKKKKTKKKDVPKDVQGAFDEIFKGQKAADVSMFGRMLADNPILNVDAACQVAHAISTHKVEQEMDFYTAVDDLQPDGETGADMMGVVEYNSACFYRYAVIHWEQLLKNLEGDVELAQATVEAFLKALPEAIPTGKQNSFAAHNPPSFVYAVVRDQNAPWSLANAFEAPVRPNGSGLTGESIMRLDDYWGKLSKMYGGGIRAGAWFSLSDFDPQSFDASQKQDDYNSLVKVVKGALS